MTFRTIVCNDLRDLALDVAGGVNYGNKELRHSAAWRKAVQTYLQDNGHIRLKRAGKVLVRFSVNQPFIFSFISQNKLYIFTWFFVK